MSALGELYWPTAMSLIVNLNEHVLWCASSPLLVPLQSIGNPFFSIRHLNTMKMDVMGRQVSGQNI